MTNSSTNDSLVDAQINGKSFTPSMTSSGYDSQAVSSQTLSSEDSASVRSMSIEDTPEADLAQQGGKKTGKLPEEGGANVANGGKKAELKPRLSLIDTEDIPSNLGSPLQPTSPLDDIDNSGSEGDETPKLLSDDSVVELSEHSQPSKSESQADSMCDIQSMTSSQTRSSQGEIPGDSQSGEIPGDAPGGDSVSGEHPGDVYSEEAMDELEKLGDTPPGDAPSGDAPLGDDNEYNSQSKSSVCAPPSQGASLTDNAPSANQGAPYKTIESQSKSETSANNKDKMAASENKMAASGNKMAAMKNNMALEIQELRDTFDDGIQRPSSAEEKAARRRSWHDAKTEHKRPAIPEELLQTGSSNQTGSSKQEVKLRKGGSIDVTRPGSLKKLRSGGESKTSKTSPSPVKATYRPVSMPIDNLVAGEQVLEELDGGNKEEDNSGTVVKLNWNFGKLSDLLCLLVTFSYESSGESGFRVTSLYV